MPIALHKDQEMAAHWKTQIELCDKENRRFHQRGKRISEKYRDDRGSASDGDRPDSGSKRSLNLFWSNVQTMKPAIYSKIPVPICERRFLDKDTTGRVASTILERTLRYEVQMSGFDNAIRRSRNDYLIPGRGMVWIRYNPKFGDAISPKQVAEDEITFDGQQADSPQDAPRVDEEEVQECEIESESLCVDYLHWQDYYTFPPNARTEDEIEGKGRRIFMSRQDLVEKFGDEIGKKIPLDHAPMDDRESGASKHTSVDNEDANQATVYEIWWRPERRVYFIAKEFDKCLIPEGLDSDGEGIDDPLKLEGFFPCPAPLNATMTNDTLIPVPDYVEAEDQYMQIDELTKRIDILVNACKVRGVYDASAQGIKRVFKEGQEPDLIPIDSWAMFAEKGGLKGAIDWVPIEDIAGTLKILIEVRQQIMTDLDMVTGISDINRGTSDPRETMGGVRIKQNASSGRLAERQEEMARYCKDIICIMGEIISELYSPETLIQVSGALHDEGLDPPALAPQAINAAPLPSQIVHNGGPPMGQAQPMPTNSPPNVPSATLPQETPEQKDQRKLMMIMNAIDLLRNDKLRGFRIDIETDSTVQNDPAEEKAAATEFISEVTKFIQISAEVTMQVPEFAPLAAKMLQFAIRRWRVGRDLESSIEDFADKVELDAKQAATQPKQPSPEQVKAQSEKEKAMAEIERQKIENQGEKENALIDLQSKQLDFEMKKLELQIEQMRMEVESQKIQAGGDGKDGGERTVVRMLHPGLALDKIGEIGTALDQAHQLMTAPRRVIRHPQTGQVVGDEPMMAPTPPPQPQLDSYGRPVPKPFKHPHVALNEIVNKAGAIHATAKKLSGPRKIRRDQRGKANGVERA